MLGLRAKILAHPSLPVATAPPESIHSASALAALTALQASGAMLSAQIPIPAPAAWLASGAPL